MVSAEQYFADMGLVPLERMAYYEYIPEEWLPKDYSRREKVERKRKAYKKIYGGGRSDN